MPPKPRNDYREPWQKGPERETVPGYSPPVGPESPYHVPPNNPENDRAVG
jgi:hypothetical protein